MFTESFTKIYKGDVTKNIEFSMGENTVVSYSCAAELNGEIYVFGGSTLFPEESPGIRKQVIYAFCDGLLKLSLRFQRS